MDGVTWFQGFAAAILATVILSYYLRKEAVATHIRAEKVAVEKAGIIDQELLKSYAITSIKIMRRIFEFAEAKFGTKKENLSEAVRVAIEETLKKSQEDLEKDIERAEMPEELARFMRITEEDRDRLIYLSFLASGLKDMIPDVSSEVVNRMTKALIYGVSCAIILFFMDAIISLGLVAIIPFIGAFAILFGIYYFYYGIVQIWPLRKLEIKLKNLKEAKNINDIEESIREITEVYE